MNLDLVTIFESTSLTVSAEEGCVVLRSPVERDSNTRYGETEEFDARIVLTRGQALLLAGMTRQFSHVFAAYLTSAASACSGTNITVPNEQDDD